MDELTSYYQQIQEYARLDHHRTSRQGMPEFVYAESKRPEQVAAIISGLVEQSGCALASRASEAHFEATRKVLPEVSFDPVSRLLWFGRMPSRTGQVSILAAGTSDLPIAEEAHGVLRFLGYSVNTLYDVGVAGVHRLLAHIEELQAADVLIVVAGMEGALPTLVGGLVDLPVIAVPTSVGYGASFQGLAALLGMLNSCAPGVTVVNIDNGLGAAAAAQRILHCQTGDTP